MAILRKDFIQISRYVEDKVSITKQPVESDTVKLLFSDQLSAAPVAPENLSVTNVGETTVDLDWDDINAPYDYDDFTIYVYNQTTSTQEQKITGISLSEVQVMGLNTGDDYEFWVVSVRIGIESAESNHVTANPVDVTAPDPATNLTVDSSTNEKADLSWDASPSSDVAGYNVYVDDGTGFSKHNTSLITSLSYSVTGLTNGDSYDFYVKAEDTSGNESSASNTVSATITDTLAPSAPTGLSETSKTGSSIDIDWDDNSESDLAGYNVYVDGVKDNGALIGVSNYQITGLVDNTSYDIYVTAVDNVGNESSPSATISVTTVDTAPSAPIGLSTTSGDTVVDLDWDDNSESDLAGYNVYVDGVKENSSLIATSDYEVTGLTNGQEYDFHVTAVDGGGNESNASSTVSATPTTDTNSVSMEFNGSSAMVDYGIPSILQYDNLGSSFSILAFIKWRSIPSPGNGFTTPVIHGGDAVNDNFQMRCEDDNVVGIYLDTDNGAGNVVTGFNPTMGQWYKIGVTYDGTELILYVDGTNVFSDSTTWGGNLTPATSAPWTLGYRVNSGWAHDGFVDEFSIWNRALTATEVNSYQSDFLVGNETDLLLYSNAEDQADPVTDLANGNDGAIIDMVYSSDVLPF